MADQSITYRSYEEMAKTPRPLPVDSSSWNAGRDSRGYKQLGRRRTDSTNISVGGSKDLPILSIVSDYLSLND
jgi:hypothetical protein